MTPRSPSSIPWKLQKITIRQPGSDSRRPTFSAESRSLVAIPLIGIGGESDQDQDNRPPREKRIPLDVQLPSTAFPKRQCRFDQYGVDPYSSAKIKLEEPLHPPTLKPKDSDYHPTNVAPAHQYSNPRVTGFQYPFQWGGPRLASGFAPLPPSPFTWWTPIRIQPPPFHMAPLHVPPPPLYMIPVLVPSAAIPAVVEPTADGVETAIGDAQTLDFTKGTLWARRRSRPLRGLPGSQQDICENGWAEPAETPTAFEVGNAYSF